MRDLTNHVCLEYLRLLSSACDAHAQLGSLTVEQIDAIKNGRPEFNRFLPRIRIARLKADLALEELVAHIQFHNCVAEPAKTLKAGG